MNVFTWMNDQLLRMQWLSDLVTAGVQAVGQAVPGRGRSGILGRVHGCGLYPESACRARGMLAK